MVEHALIKNFTYFFNRINPSPSFVHKAAKEHESICALIENPRGFASILSPKCFLQGSYKQDTAIYTINDVDIVVLCELWQPGSEGVGTKAWSRNEIFDTIAAPLLSDGRYRDKVRYHENSMCIKVDLGIKIEILPVVFKKSNTDPTKEPFRLYRPENQKWEDGYARYHQNLLTMKNSIQKTGGNFKPAIKVFKHLRSLYNINAVSFHIECLLFSLPDYVFLGSPAEYIAKILNHIAKYSADEWYETGVKTPCGERNIFSESEWNKDSWNEFHKYIKLWTKCASLACATKNATYAIEAWQILLGENYFPKNVTT